MAMLQMQRIYIYALKKDRKPLLEMLQRRGVIEVSDNLPEDSVFHKTDTSYAKTNFEKSISVCKDAAEILDKYVPVEKPLLAMLNGRKTVSGEQYDEFKEKHEATVRTAGRIITCNKEIIEHKAEIQRLEVQAEMLMPWTALDIPLKFSQTAHTSSYIGTLPKEVPLEEIYEKLAEYMPVNVDIISTSKEQTCIFVLCTKKHAQGVFDALRLMDFSYPSVTSEKAPSEQLQEIEQLIKQNNAEIEEAVNEMKELAAFREDILFLQDYDRMRYDKYDVIGKLLQSKNVFVISGYIAKNEAEAIEQELTARFDAAVEFEEPTEDEDIPVLLKNNGFAQPLEGVVEGFSLPGKGEVDPTFMMALFYYFLFGIMLADGGYGLLIVIACGYGLIKGKATMEQSTKNFLMMFLFCGISTTFWGVMFGSYFGDVIDVVGMRFFGVKELPVIPALWFVPVNRPMQMLSFSMILGIVHILAGLGIKIYQLIKQKDYLGIVYDALSWVVLLVSGTLLLVSLDMIKNILSITFELPGVVVTASAVLAVISSIVIVLTNGRESKNPFKRFLKGAYALYGITGYLSDVLSYSRLLALGLASGVIASVINKMAAMAAKGVVGAIIMIIILFAGHTINFAINILGAYVHTNRLQYVEFFGKFYGGGGRAFNPFNMRTKYYKIKESK